MFKFTMNIENQSNLKSRNNILFELGAGKSGSLDRRGTIMDGCIGRGKKQKRKFTKNKKKLSTPSKHCMRLLFYEYVFRLDDPRLIKLIFNVMNHKRKKLIGLKKHSKIYKRD